MKHSFKPYDTEEHLDYFFYRPAAWLIVKGVVNTSITPNHLTIISLLLGIASGGFLYFSEYAYIITGIFLLMLSNIFDCSDGQLARTRPSGGSMAGRILDGLSDYLVFTSIYLASVLKFYSEPILMIEGLENYGLIILIIAIAASLGHYFQTVFFDYYRNEYIKYTTKSYESESTTIELIKNELNSIENNKWFNQLLLRIYLAYTAVQQKLNKKNNLSDKYEISENFSQLYKAKNSGLLRLWSFIGSTNHVTYIMIFAAFNRIDLFLIFEATILNIYMIILKIKQNKTINSLKEELSK